MSMSLRTLLTFSVVLLAISGTALGWGGPSHSALAEILFDDPLIQVFTNKFGVDVNAVTSWMGEPPSEWHHPGWSMIQARGYHGTYAGNNWDALDETTRLRYLTHIALDCGVPVGHSPASHVWSNTTKEAWLEAQVSTWSTYPSISGRMNYANSETGYITDFTGKIGDITNRFYGGAINNAQWSKDNLGFYMFDYNDYRHAGWNGTALGLFLGRAVLIDYFLGKIAPIAGMAEQYVVSPGGSVTFELVNAFDPDYITWNSDGTYFNQANAGLTYALWYINGDEVWDFSGASVTYTYDELVAMGLTPGEWSDVRLTVRDDEMDLGYNSAPIYLYPAGGAVPEPATMSLLAVGILGLLRRRKR